MSKKRKIKKLKKRNKVLTKKVYDCLNKKVNKRYDDLLSFGNYLLSEERYDTVINKDFKNNAYMGDILNWERAEAHRHEVITETGREEIVDMHPDEIK